MYIINTMEHNENYSLRSKKSKIEEVLYSYFSGKSNLTKKSYEMAMKSFLTFCEISTEQLDKVTPLMVIKFKEFLIHKNSISTTSQRLSALSSIFNYLVRNSIIITNPISLIDRQDLKVNPYENSKVISMEDFNRVISSIPDTRSGIRDKVIFLMIYISGLRRSSIHKLKGSDIQVTNGKTFFKTTLKGGTITKKEIPEPIWRMIEKYLEMEKRELVDDDYIFQPTTNSGKYLLKYHNRKSICDGLSSELLNKRFKKYSNSIGVKNVTLHSIRHLGAVTFYESSNDLVETMNFLNHKNVNTTQIYLTSLNGEEHNHWQNMMNRIK